MLGIFAFKIRRYVKKLSNEMAYIFMTMGFVGFILIFAINFIHNDEMYVYKGFFERVGEPDYRIFGKLFLLIPAFIYLEKFFNYENKYFRYVSSISFGIFFIHGLVIVSFNKFIAPKIHNEIGLFIFEFIFTISISILIIEIVKKAFKSRSRYVIGC